VATRNMSDMEMGMGAHQGNAARERRQNSSRRTGTRRWRKSYDCRQRSYCVPTTRRIRGGGDVLTNCRRSVGMATLTEFGRSWRHCYKVLTMDSGSGDAMRTIGTRRG
jgi:hypothetical protein